MKKKTLGILMAISAANNAVFLVGYIFNSRLYTNAYTVGLNASTSSVFWNR